MVRDRYVVSGRAGRETAPARRTTRRRLRRGGGFRAGAGRNAGDAAGTPDPRASDVFRTGRRDAAQSPDRRAVGYRGTRAAGTGRPAGAGGFVPDRNVAGRTEAERRRAVFSQPLALARKAWLSAGPGARESTGIRGQAGSAGRSVHGTCAAWPYRRAAQLVGDGRSGAVPAGWQMAHRA